MLWGEVKRDEEEKGLQRDDHAAGRSVEEIADIGADEARRNAESDADQNKAPEAIGEQIGGCTGRHHHSNDEAGPNRLQGGDRASAEQREEHHLEHTSIETDA